MLILLSPVVAQDLNQSGGLVNGNKHPVNPLVEKIDADYAKEEASGRPTGGLSAPGLDGNNNGDYQRRPSGGLSDSVLDGKDGSGDYAERPSKGLSDSVLDEKNNNDNYQGRPSGGLSDSVLDGK